jgi:hypothetical protein
LERTDLSEEEAAAHRKAIEEFVPMKRFGEPKEIADAAYFLVGDQATYVSDQSLRLMALLVPSSQKSESRSFFYAFISHHGMNFPFSFRFFIQITSIFPRK